MTAITIAPQTLRPGESATVTATVFNASPLPIAKCPVRLHVEAGEQKRDLERAIDLEGGAAASVAFALETLPEGFWLGHVEARPAMNYHLTIAATWPCGSRRPAHVLIVDGDPGRPRTSRRPTSCRPLCGSRRGERYGKTPFDARAVDLVAGASLPDLEKTEAVVLANVGSLSASDAHAPGRVRRARGWLARVHRRSRHARRDSRARGGGPGCGRRFSGPRPQRTCPGGSSDGRPGTPSSSRSTTPSTATCAGRCSRRSRGSSPTGSSSAGVVPRW